MSLSSLVFPRQVWRWHPEQATSTPQRSLPPPRPPQAATVGWAEPPHLTLSRGWPAATGWTMGRTTGVWWGSSAPLRRWSEGVRRSKLRMGLPFWWCPTRSSPQATTSPVSPSRPKREKPTGTETVGITQPLTPSYISPLTDRRMIMLFCVFKYYFGKSKSWPLQIVLQYDIQVSDIERMLVSKVQEKINSSYSSRTTDYQQWWKEYWTSLLKDEYSYIA